MVGWLGGWVVSNLGELSTRKANRRVPPLVQPTHIDAGSPRGSQIHDLCAERAPEVGRAGCGKCRKSRFSEIASASLSVVKFRPTYHTQPINRSQGALPLGGSGRLGPVGEYWLLG